MAANCHQRHSVLAATGRKPFCQSWVNNSIHIILLDSISGRGRGLRDKRYAHIRKHVYIVYIVPRFQSMGASSAHNGMLNIGGSMEQGHVVIPKIKGRKLKCIGAVVWWIRRRYKNCQLRCRTMEQHTGYPWPRHAIVGLNTYCISHDGGIN